MLLSASPLIWIKRNGWRKSFKEIPHNGNKFAISKAGTIPLSKQQGITRIPANILIGPDKRVITQDIQGKELIDKVRQLTEQDKEKEKAAKEAERARKRQNKK